MAIFRGVGGSGDSSDNSFLQEVTAQANAAEASATSAANSLASIQETEVTSASFDTSDGVLTLTKTGGATVTADLDGRFLTSYTETNNLSSAVTWANVPDANITQSSVTQHQAALSITESQISNLQSYLTTHQDITGKASLSGATFTGDVLFNNGVKAKFGTDSDLLIYHNDGEPSVIEDAGELGLVLKTNGNIFAVVTDTNENMITATPDGGVSLFYDNTSKLVVGETAITINDDLSVHTGNNMYVRGGDLDVTGDIAVSGTVDGRDLAIDGTKLDGIETNATADQTDAEIKTAYENNADTNAFTDADHTKLDGLERTVRQRFQRRGYNNTLSFNSLTTSYAQVVSTLRINSGATTAVENVLDLNISANFGDINSTNDGLFIVTVDAPNPSNETTVNLGTATYITLGVFSVSGDFTKHFSPYCGLSKNSDGSNAFSFSNQQGWDYDPVTDKTTIYFYPYQANTPSTGDTVYLHPFDWETTGTEINGDEYPIDAYNALGTVNVNQFQQIYLGYYKPERSFKIKAKETTTSESISLARVSGTYSQIIGS